MNRSLKVVTHAAIALVLWSFSPVAETRAQGYYPEVTVPTYSPPTVTYYSGSSYGFTPPTYYSSYYAAPVAATTYYAPAPTYTSYYTAPAYTSYYRAPVYTNAYYTPAYTSYYYPPVYNTYYAPRRILRPSYYYPGPYYYTPTYSYTPGYYSYYYTPGYFRY